MYLLVKLARFINPQEQQQVSKDIEKFVKSFSNSYQTKKDDWISKNRIILKLDLINSKVDTFLQGLLKTPGIASVVKIPLKLYNLESESFSHLIHTLINFIEENGYTDYAFDFRNIGKAPLHKKAIIDRLGKKNIYLSSTSEFLLYLEIRSQPARKAEPRKIIQARIGRKFKLQNNKTDFNQTFIPKLILYSPFTVQEVADFCRLSLTFRMDIILSNENNLSEELIEKVRTSYFKGIDKIKYNITPSLEKFIANSINKSVGFSLWGTKPINELPIAIQKMTSIESIKPVIYFIFGNEEVGLPLTIRKQISMFRIGIEPSEPLRASQAAAFALGTLFSLS